MVVPPKAAPVPEVVAEAPEPRDEVAEDGVSAEEPGPAAEELQHGVPAEEPGPAEELPGVPAEEPGLAEELPQHGVPAEEHPWAEVFADRVRLDRIPGESGERASGSSGENFDPPVTLTAVSTFGVFRVQGLGV